MGLAEQVEREALGGEAAGGFNKHGLGKGTVQGFIAGTNAAGEQRT